VDFSGIIGLGGGFLGIYWSRRWISRESWGKGGARWGKRRGFKEFYWSRRWISRERWGKGGASWGKGGGGPPRKPFANAMNRELSQKGAKGGKNHFLKGCLDLVFCLFPRVRRFFSPDSHPLSGAAGAAEVVAGERGGAPERKAARPSQKTTGGRGFLPKKSGFCGGKIGFLRND